MILRLFCPNCNHTQCHGSFCGKCGHEMSYGAIKEKPQEEYTCKACKKKVQEITLFCIKCGQKAGFSN